MAYSVKTLGGSRVQLTYVEVVASLALAGWHESEWAKAAAVIAAESDRVVNIYNTYKQGHYGLMQISKSAHPGFFSSLPNKNAWVDPVKNIEYGYKLRKQSGFRPWEAYTNGRYSGYLAQATAAVSTVKAKRNKVGAGGRSREFYESLFRKKTLAEIEAIQLGEAVGSVGDAIAGGAGATADAVAAAGAAAAAAAQTQAGGIGGFLMLAVGAGKWLTQPENWIRVGQVGVGAALVIGGIHVVAKGTPLGKAAGTVKSAAVGAATRGAVATKTAATKTTAPKAPATKGT